MSALGADLPLKKGHSGGVAGGGVAGCGATAGVGWTTTGRAGC